MDLGGRVWGFGLDFFLGVGDHQGGGWGKIKSSTFICSSLNALPTLSPLLCDVFVMHPTSATAVQLCTTDRAAA